MENQVSLYKELSLQMLKSLKEDKLDDLEEFINKREIVINEINDIVKFKEVYKNDDISEIDQEIHSLFTDKLEHIKKEIKEHKKTQRVNISYINASKENINIFNKKV